MINTCYGSVSMERSAFYILSSEIINGIPMLSEPKHNSVIHYDEI